MQESLGNDLGHDALSRSRDARRPADDGRRDVSFSVDYDLLVPERLPVTLRNRFGDVAVTGMKAGGSIANASGRVIAVDGAAATTSRIASAPSKRCAWPAT